MDHDETSRITLTEFLLARIAEDEKAANHGGSHPESWGVMANDNYGHLLIQPQRVLAECEAKRRIVDHFTSSAAWAGGGPEALPNFEGFRAAMEFVLGKLAAPYADHPDFRPEWR